jgi:cytochrome P450
MGSFSNCTDSAPEGLAAVTMLFKQHQFQTFEAYMIIIIATIATAVVLWRVPRGKKLPPRAMNSFSFFWNFTTDPMKCLNDLQARYGNIYEAAGVVWLFDVHFALKFNTGDPHNKIPPADKPYKSKVSDMMFGDDGKSMLLKQTSHPSFHGIRKAFASNFSMKLSGQYLSASGEIMEAWCDYLDKFAHPESEQVVNLSNLVYELTGELTHLISFGTTDCQFGDPENPHLDLTLRIVKTIDIVSKRLFSPITNFMYKWNGEKTFRNEVNVLVEIIQKRIDERRLLLAAQQEEPDFLPSLCDRLMQTKEYEGNNLLLVADLMLALGPFTTFISIMGILLCIGKDPGAQKRLQRELDEVNPERKKWTPDMLRECKFLDNVQKEALRLYPAGGLGSVRVAPVDYEFEGHFIPKGTKLQFPMYQMFRDPRYFKDPHVFNPDRWAADSPELPALMAVKGYIYTAGPRACPARTFANLEMLEVLAKVVQRFDLETLDEGKKDFFFILSVDDARMRFKRREAQA